MARPMTPQPVQGQKMERFQKPHGSRTGASVGTTTGAVVFTLTGAFVGTLTGAVIVSVTVVGTVGVRVGTLAGHANVATFASPKVLVLARHVPNSKQHIQIGVVVRRY